MRVLVIKLTSMGDLVHALPALTDARQRFPELQVDWVVDEAFKEIPTWHPAVRQVIPSAHRRWKRRMWHHLLNRDYITFLRQLNAVDYEYVIDMQNNLKSALVTCLRRRGLRCGLDWRSVREAPAHWAYLRRYYVAKNQHAITRQRQLMSQALGYPCPDSPPDYGVDPAHFKMPDVPLPSAPYLVFVHNASWDTKLWPEEHWYNLIELAVKAGFHVFLPCGNRGEHERAQRLAAGREGVTALPRLSLTDVAGLLRRARGVVSCDTGLAHLTALVGTPAVSFYGPTDHRLIGATGASQEHFVAGSAFACAPCYRKTCNYGDRAAADAACMRDFSVGRVWQSLQRLIFQNERCITQSVTFQSSSI